MQSQGVDKEAIQELLFSPELKEKVMEDMGIKSKQVFNNLLSSMRKKGVLSRENVISDTIKPPYIKGGFILTLNFIDDGSDKEGKIGDIGDSG